MILAWNGLDLLVRPVRPRESAEPRLTPAVVFGFLIGVLGGAVGVILGTLRMPALLGSVSLTAKQAVGTNLVIGFALGTVAFATRVPRQRRLADPRGRRGAPGGWFGARLTGRIAEQTLRRAIGVALLAISLVFLAEVVFGLWSADVTASRSGKTGQQMKSVTGRLPAGSSLG